MPWLLMPWWCKEPGQMASLCLNELTGILKNLACFHSRKFIWDYGLKCCHHPGLKWINCIQYEYKYFIASLTALCTTMNMVLRTLGRGLARVLRDFCGKQIKNHKWYSESSHEFSLFMSVLLNDSVTTLMNSHTWRMFYLLFMFLITLNKVEAIEASVSHSLFFVYHLAPRNILSCLTCWLRHRCGYKV